MTGRAAVWNLFAELGIEFTGRREADQFERAMRNAEKSAKGTEKALKGVEGRTRGVGSGLRSAGQASQRASRDFDRSSGALSRLRQGAALAATALGGAVVVGAKKAITASADLGEQVSKASVVFRGSEKEVIAWSKTMTNGFGMSQRAALEAAGVLGNMLVPMGLTRSAAADMSRSLVELGGDMASFNNASPEETLDALRAGLSGETEPLRRFGVRLSAARVEMEALTATGKKNKDQLTDAEKAQAAYNIILQDTKDQQGDFKRTATSLPNLMRTLRGEVENVAASFGTMLLPYATKFAKWAKEQAVPAVRDFIKEMKSGKGTGGDLVKTLKGLLAAGKELVPVVTTMLKAVAEVGSAFAALPGPVKQFIVAFAGFAFIGTKIAGVVAAMKAAGGVLGGLRMLAPMALNPWVLAAAAIGAAAFAIIKNWDKVAPAIGRVGMAIRQGLSATWNFIKRTASSAFSAVAKAARSGLLGPIPLIISRWGQITGFFGRLPGRISSIFSGLAARVRAIFTGVVNGVVNTIKGIPGRVGGAVADAANTIKSLPGRAAGSIGGALGSLLPGRQMGGPVGPGAGGPRVFVAGEGSRHEYVLSHEGDSRKNIGWALSFLAEKGVIQGFRKGGIPGMKRAVARYDARYHRLERDLGIAQMDAQRDGKITPGESKRLNSMKAQQIRVVNAERATLRDLLTAYDSEINGIYGRMRGMKKGKARNQLLERANRYREEMKDARAKLRDLNDRSAELRAEQRGMRHDAAEARKAAALDRVVKTKFDDQIDSLETNLELAKIDTPNDTSDDRAITQQLLEAAKGRLGVLRQRLAKATDPEQIKALREAVRGAAGTVGGLMGDAAGMNPALQFAAFNSARFDLAQQFGSNATPAMGKQRMGAPTINQYYTQPPKDPHAWTRSVEHELSSR